MRARQFRAALHHTGIGQLKAAGIAIHPSKAERFIYDGVRLHRHQHRREWDPDTSLYYNRARYYDPRIGRFFSQDPIGFDAGDSNLYRYVGNNPVNNTDPTGFCAQAISTISTALNPIMPIASGLGTAIGSTVSTTSPSLASGWNTTSSWAGSAWNGLSSGIGSVASNAFSSISSAWNSASSWASSTWSDISSGTYAPSIASEPWKAPTRWNNPIGIGSVRLRMTGETMDDGRIRLGYKWSQRIADDLDQRINQYDIVLPAGTSLETINRLRAIASDMANGYGMLAAEKDLIHALEQSKEILKQSAVAAGTAGLGSAFTAARASQVAWVANAGRMGQVAMGGYAAYEGGRGVVQGVQEIRQGNYLTPCASFAVPEQTAST